MNRHPDPLLLQQRARALRSEALRGMARAAAIKWKALLDVSPDAPLPCKGPAPSHP